MPARTLLSSEQRARLFAIPTDPAEMARHYVLECRRPGSRAEPGGARATGWASLFSFARSAILAACSDPSESPPEPMLAFVAKQIGVDPALFGDYARRAETRREHAARTSKTTAVSGASVSPTGGPASGSARMRRGPRIAASPSSRRCSPICGRTAFCFPRRRCWSGSGWRLGRARERRPSRPWRPA